MKWIIIGLSMIGSSVLALVCYIPIYLAMGSSFNSVSQDVSTHLSITEGKPESADELTQKPEPNSVAKWIEIEAIYPRYVARQEEVAIELGNQLLAELRTMHEAMDGEAFANEIMGLEAMWESFGSDASVKDFVQRSFANHVLDVSDVEQLIESYLTALDARLAELDNQFLIACQLDVEFDPETLGETQVDLTDLRHQFADVGDRLHATIEEAFYTNVVVFFIENGVGEVGSQLGYELGKDQYGNPTLASEFYSFVLGMTADVVAGEIANQAIGTEEDIARQAREVGGELIVSQLYFEGSSEPLWLASMRQAMLLRRLKAVAAIESVIGDYPVQPETPQAAEKGGSHE